jgi:hypothetical protein
MKLEIWLASKTTWMIPLAWLLLLSAACIGGSWLVARILVNAILGGE